MIVNSIIKSTQSYYGINSFLPKNIGQLSKFANYQKCNAKDVEDLGRKACKNSLPTLVENNESMFFSPSGNYKINMDFSYEEKWPAMFLVKANPNGLNYKDEGSAVVGCYSPTSGVSLVKEFSGKPSDRGEKSFIQCGDGINIAQGREDETGDDEVGEENLDERMKPLEAEREQRLTEMNKSLLDKVLRKNN